MSKYTMLMVGEVVLAVVILGSMFIKVTTKSPTDLTSPTAASGDEMADHHKSKPADTAAFRGLMDDTAPDFELATFEGKKVKLSELRGKNVLLFFNEGLMCYPACWEQIAAFGQDGDFSKSNTVVLNITVDPKAQWERAVAQMPKLATATVLLDTDKSVSSKYGVMSLESSMHRGQFPGHTYVLIDKEGVIRYLLDDPQMAVRNKQLLEEAAKL